MHNTIFVLAWYYYLCLYLWNILCVLSHSVVSDCSPVDCSPLAPLSMEFSRQEYWSGLPVPTPGDLLNLGTESASLVSVCWQANSLTREISFRKKKINSLSVPQGPFFPQQPSDPYLFTLLYYNLVIQLLAECRCLICDDLIVTKCFLHADFFSAHPSKLGVIFLQ